MPKNFSPRMTEEQYQKMLERMIERYHLNDPYPVQYFYWLTSLVQGNWGYSPTLHEDVLTALLRRTPATAELTLYSILIFIPLGLVSGVIAGSRRNRLADHGFRLTAFVATSLPPFILAMILIAIFYVDLHWFAPERTSMAVGFVVNSDQFRQYTGLLTIDGLLNGRPDISLDALRHLVMPVFTLALIHWATLGRVMRATMIDEGQKDYVVAAKARGIPSPRITWRHTLRNAIAPALTSSLLSAASLLTGVFVVEMVYTYHGVSAIAVSSMQFIPDAPAAMGFAIYSVIVVLILMGILDLIQSGLDPRIREAI
jgi:peptide/nickel transport system permease protein